MSRMRVDNQDITDAHIFEILLDNFPDIIHSVDDDGNIIEDLAREKSATYYYIDGRLKGEETADYMIKRSHDGDIISTTIYYYEDGYLRASESEPTDRMSKSVTYRNEVDATAADADEDGILDGYETQLASITYFDYEEREQGKEVADYTEKYNTSQQVVSLIVYL